MSAAQPTPTPVDWGNLLAPVKLPVDGGKSFLWEVDGIELRFTAPEGKRQNDMHTFAVPASIKQAGDLKLSLTNDQLQFATAELHYLLQSVPDCLLRLGPELDQALRRYEDVWVPLLAKQADGATLVPPPDVACRWCWMVRQPPPALPCPPLSSTALPCPPLPSPALPCPPLPSPALPCPPLPSPDRPATLMLRRGLGLGLGLGSGLGLG